MKYADISSLDFKHIVSEPGLSKVCDFIVVAKEKGQKAEAATNQEQ